VEYEMEYDWKAMGLPAKDEWTVMDSLPTGSAWETVNGRIEVIGCKVIPAKIFKIIARQEEYLIEVEGKQYWSHRVMVLVAIGAITTLLEPNVADMSGTLTRQAKSSADNDHEPQL
jgi:hypothetical protein